jgi:hypothetical protein
MSVDHAVLLMGMEAAANGRGTEFVDDPAVRRTAEVETIARLTGRTAPAQALGTNDLRWDDPVVDTLPRPGSTATDNAPTPAPVANVPPLWEAPPRSQSAVTVKLSMADRATLSAAAAIMQRLAGGK